METSGLTKEEVRRIFPSFADLKRRCGHHSYEDWGLCYWEGSCWFGKRHEKLPILQVPLQKILEKRKLFPFEGDEDLYLMYGVRVFPPMDDEGRIQCVVVNIHRVKDMDWRNGTVRQNQRLYQGGEGRQKILH